MRRLLPLLLLLPLAGEARADKWMPPEVTTVLAADRSARLTVIPPAPSSTSSAVVATLERRAGGGWKRLWSRPLPTGFPVQAVVANRAAGFATLDPHGALGYGPHVVGIYRADGRLVRSLALTDLVPAWYVELLPHSASSIHWRGLARLTADGRTLLIPVVRPGPPDQPFAARRTLDLAVSMRDGRPHGLASPDWQQALSEALPLAHIECESRRATLAGKPSPSPEWLAVCDAPQSLQPAGTEGR